MTFNQETLIAYVKASQTPVSARNMALKFKVQRKVVTRTLYLAALDDPAIKMTLLKPHNVKHKKPVWHHSGISSTAGLPCTPV
jgi:hypothetical protein